MWVWVWELGSAQAQPQDEATQAQVLQAAPAQEEPQSPILLPSMMTGRHVVGPALRSFQIPSRTAERVPQTQAELHNPCRPASPIMTSGTGTRAPATACKPYDVMICSAHEGLFDILVRISRLVRLLLKQSRI